MNTRHRTTTVLLAVVAVLLGLNLARPRAEAQPQAQLQIAPRVVDMHVEFNRVWRMWSDGVVEIRSVYHNGNICQSSAPHWHPDEWAELPICDL